MKLTHTFVVVKNMYATECGMNTIHNFRIGVVKRIRIY